MKRKAEVNALMGPRKKLYSDLSGVEDSLADNTYDATSIGEIAWDPELKDSQDDNESLFSETSHSAASNEPPAHTAATSIAASTTSRAGRKFPSDLKTIQCPEPGCSKTFNRPARLTAHLRSHSNDRPFKCKQPGCDKSYMEEKHLRQHVKGSHTQERKYVCEEPGCDKSFLTGTRLRRHAAVHEGANRFRCTGYEGCDQSFRKHQTLQRHIRTVHLGQNPYICATDGCGEGFDSPNAMKRHVEREHGEPKFWCDECEDEGEDGSRTGFTTLQLLQAHVREMHVGCPFCDKKCSGQRDLEKHVDALHSGKPPEDRKPVEDRKTIACTWEGCPKKFVKVANLNAHIKTAHEGHRFVCGQVDTFDWSEDIADWNWMEEGCGDAFISKMKLEEHIRFIHLGKKRPPTVYPDPTRDANAIKDLSGATSSNKRNLLCTEIGCRAGFIRYHDLNVHVQKVHNNGHRENDIETLAVATPEQSLMPVDPQLHPGGADFGTGINDEAFWFGGNIAEEPREDSFERDLADMRMLIDVDALVSDERAGH
ncbi:hypothetical protein GQ53DRAFT_744407 [Thozetella sp. PMI_491]|nr:hypothetical protein GQ53DRAFT_744407 [Thozetella sp. PMI_491]